MTAKIKSGAIQTNPPVSPLGKGGRKGLHRAIENIDVPDATWLRAVRKRLLEWYDENRRDLPWRRRRDDPYAQWVAEVMLQQTRVETVLKFYERFLARFPTPAALARADSQIVLKHWEGLGYYRRIMHLHRAVKSLVVEGRAIPTTIEGLRELPGVGEYTAAAIASIAFGVPAAAVDGNVARVISRLVRLPDSPKRTRGKKTVGRLAGQLLSTKRPGDFNQAWMDLGSMICTPTSPRCEVCPLLAACAAGRLGDADSFPVIDPNAWIKPARVRLATGVFRRDGRVIVERREEGGLWSGLWEYPSTTVASKSDAKLALTAMAGGLGIRIVGSPRPIGEVRHELTHRSICFDVWVAEVEAHQSVVRKSTGSKLPVARTLAKLQVANPQTLRWVTHREFARLPVSTAYRKVHQAVTSAEQR